MLMSTVTRGLTYSEISTDPTVFNGFQFTSL
jgi:hypothetical protein